MRPATAIVVLVLLGIILIAGLVQVWAVVNPSEPEFIPTTSSRPSPGQD